MTQNTPEPQDDIDGGLMVQSQVIITLGFDGDGDQATWVTSSAGSLVEALGMLEVAKHFVLKQYEEQAG